MNPPIERKVWKTPVKATPVSTTICSAIGTCLISPPPRKLEDFGRWWEALEDTTAQKRSAPLMLTMC